MAIAVTYVEHDGTEHVVSVDVGLNLMQAAQFNRVPGIEGDCGGLCACGTCHVYIRGAWKDKVPVPEELEVNILDFAFDVDDDSRLACQLRATEALDGIVVHMPKRQY